MFRNRFLITNMKYPNIKPNPEDEEFLESDMMNLTQTITNEDQKKWEENNKEIREKIKAVYEQDEDGVPEDLEEDIQNYIVPRNYLQKKIFKKGIRKPVDDVRKIMQDYIQKNGKINFVDPHGGEIVWETPRAPETQEKISAYMKSVRSNTHWVVQKNY